MESEATTINGVTKFTPSTHHDYRGEILTIYSDDDITTKFVEDKISISTKHVLRGLHGDYRTTKLLACLSGSVFLAIVDARLDSPTYGKSETFILNDKNRCQLLIPPGVFNGHLCLSEECIFWYKLSAYYAGPSAQFTLAWDADPNIHWPIPNPILAVRDKNGGTLESVSQAVRTKDTIVAVSGYFNPLHDGHIRLFHDAKKLGDKLVVIVNNDAQVSLKGSKKFQDQNLRLNIVSSIKCVDHAVLSLDLNRSVARTLEAIQPHIFANGGDVTASAPEETEVCERLKIKQVFGVGGDKIQSSSWLLAKIDSQDPFVERWDK